MSSGDCGTTVPARHRPLKRRTAGIAILVAAALLALAAPAGASKSAVRDRPPGRRAAEHRRPRHDAQRRHRLPAADDPVGRGRVDPGHVRLVVGRRDDPPADPARDHAVPLPLRDAELGRQAGRAAVQRRRVRRLSAEVRADAGRVRSVRRRGRRPLRARRRLLEGAGDAAGSRRRRGRPRRRSDCPLPIICPPPPPPPPPPPNATADRARRAGAPSPTRSPPGRSGTSRTRPSTSPRRRSRAATRGS